MNKKIILFSFLIFSILLSFIICPTTVKASTADKEELMQVLNEYQNDLGNLQQLKVIIDQMNSDLNNATTINDTVKAKLTEDIDKLQTVEGMNPLVLNVLEVELKSHVENADNSNVDDLKEEFTALKEWVDVKAKTSDNGNNNNQNPTNDKTTKPDDTTTKDSTLPQTGKTLTIVLLVAGMLVFATFCIVKYKTSLK